MLPQIKTKWRGKYIDIWTLSKSFRLKVKQHAGWHGGVFVYKSQMPFIISVCRSVFFILLNIQVFFACIFGLVSIQLSKTVAIILYTFARNIKCILNLIFYLRKIYLSCTYCKCEAEWMESSWKAKLLWELNYLSSLHSHFAGYFLENIL